MVSITAVIVRVLPETLAVYSVSSLALKPSISVFRSVAISSRFLPVDEVSKSSPSSVIVQVSPSPGFQVSSAPSMPFSSICALGVAAITCTAEFSP